MQTSLTLFKILFGLVHFPGGRSSVLFLQHQDSSTCPTLPSSSDHQGGLSRISSVAPEKSMFLAPQQRNESRQLNLVATVTTVQSLPPVRSMPCTWTALQIPLLHTGSHLLLYRPTALARPASQLALKILELPGSVPRNV